VSAEPVGRRTSWPLTEARTVLSRAETAIAHLQRRSADAETAEIVAELEVVVERLDRFRRTGRSRS
jgi:plasmid stabilization system protein ParE